MGTRTLLITLAVAACSFPPSGISRDRAIQLALQGGTALQQPVVIGAREGRLAELRNDPSSRLGTAADQERLVWEITLQGQVSICKPTGQGCVVAPGTSRVYLDHATGAFISSETSANPGPFPT